MTHSYGSMGSDTNGQQLTLKIHSGIHYIRIRELEQYSKYQYNGNLTMFQFNDEGFYDFLKRIDFSDAVKNISEVQEWVKDFYPDTYDKVMEKEKDIVDDIDDNKSPIKMSFKE